MTSRIQSIYAPYHGTDILDGLGAGIARFVTLVSLWVERDRQRHHLAGLDARMLKDIGTTRVDARAEVEKPFWRA
jgi:uncharacterized protein YjiS (DUF1127 family)